MPKNAQVEIRYLVLAAILLLALMSHLFAPQPVSEPPTGPPPTQSPTTPKSVSVTPAPTAAPIRTPFIRKTPTTDEAAMGHPLMQPNVRWARMPLAVFLNTSNERYIRAYERAAEIWKNGTNGLVSFVLVNSPKQEANITFRWFETVTSEETYLGKTSLSTVDIGEFNLSTDAKIVMRIEAGPCDSDTSIVNVVAHELGHALGLGHESRYQTLMTEQLRCQFYSLPEVPEQAKKALKILYNAPEVDFDWSLLGR